METNIQEIWKDVVGYEDKYQVSDLGRVKGYKILSIAINKHGYSKVYLYKKSKKRTFQVHRIVMHAFNGYSHLKVDHKNGVKTDNRLINLRYCTQRMNVIHHYEIKNKFIGAFKNGKKWRALTNFNGRQFHLGTFDTQEEAANKYQEAIKNIETYGHPIDIKFGISK